MPKDNSNKELKKEIMEKDNEEARINGMKYSLIIIVICVVLFLLALKFKNQYPILGYLGIIPGLVLGFMIMVFFKYLFKG